MNPRVSTLGMVASAALAVLLALPATALAQAKTGSLGGGAGAGPVMTRDELRACLKSQDTLKQRVADYEAQKTALDRDKAAITAESQKLGVDKGSAAADASKIDAVNARQTDLSRRIEDWNTRFAEFEKAGRSGPIADRQRRRLLEEQNAMEREAQALEAERKGLSGVGAGVADMNAANEALNARITAWNQRNKTLAALSEDLAQERDLWAGECGSRRYREDDEIAIKQGK